MPNCTNAVCKPSFSFALSSSHRPNISLSLSQVQAHRLSRGPYAAV